MKRIYTFLLALLLLICMGTYACAEAIPQLNEPLKRGTNGTAVQSIQTRLIELGYLGGNADGIFGAGTEKAVKAFQGQHGFFRDGIVDDDVLNAMFDEAAIRYEDFDYRLLDIGEVYYEYDYFDNTWAMVGKSCGSYIEESGPIREDIHESKEATFTIAPMVAVDDDGEVVLALCIFDWNVYDAKQSGTAHCLKVKVGDKIYSLDFSDWLKEGIVETTVWGNIHDHIYSDDMYSIAMTEDILNMVEEIALYTAKEAYDEIEFRLYYEDGEYTHITFTPCDAIENYSLTDCLSFINAWRNARGFNLRGSFNEQYEQVLSTYSRVTITNIER